MESKEMLSRKKERVFDGRRGDRTQQENTEEMKVEIKTEERGKVKEGCVGRKKGYSLEEREDRKTQTEMKVEVKTEK